MSRARILVVEDNAMNRRLVRDILAHRGHEVLEATGVEDGRRLLSAELDLVLLDIQMPGGGGEKLLAVIRETPALSKLAVVAVTASALPGERDRLLGLGFDEYISKPIDTRTFGPHVESLLRKKGTPDGTAAT